MSITQAISQALSSLYPKKITDDFHKYLQDEEYDSDIIKNDLDDDEPYIIDHLITQNPKVFNNETLKHQLLIAMQQLTTQHNTTDLIASLMKTNFNQFNSNKHNSQIFNTYNNSICIKNNINKLKKDLNDLNDLSSMELIRKITAEDKAYQDQLNNDQKYAQQLQQNDAYVVPKVAIDDNNNNSAIYNAEEACINKYKYNNWLRMADYDILYEFGYTDIQIEKAILTIIREWKCIENIEKVKKQNIKLQLNLMLDTLMTKDEYSSSELSSSLSEASIHSNSDIDIDQNVDINSNIIHDIDNIDNNDHINNDDEFELDKRWEFIYNEFKQNYIQESHAKKYYNQVIAIVEKHRFEIDNVLDDLYDYSRYDVNESQIAEGIWKTFDWEQYDLNVVRVIELLKLAINTMFDKQKKNPNIIVDAIAIAANNNDIKDNKDNDIVQLNNNDIIDKKDDDDIFNNNANNNNNNNDNDDDIDTIKNKIGVIIGLKDNNKYATKIKKYELFISALSIFGQRRFCCLLRLYLRLKMTSSDDDKCIQNNILNFIKYKYNDKYKQFNDINDNRFNDVFRISFGPKLIGHRSIIRKLDKQYQIQINIKLIQIWMIVIIRKMNEYYLKTGANYNSCHNIFCIRLLPTKYIKNKNKRKYINNNNVSLIQSINEAYKLLTDMENNNLNKISPGEYWYFVIDFSDNNCNNIPSIYFESKDLYDDDIINESEYNSNYASNILYHLKRIDYETCSMYDNTAMAIQISFHKYDTNNTIMWLTHSSGHLPFFEDDIISFLPKLFKKSSDIITCNQWNEIKNKYKFLEFKQMDRMYKEISNAYDSFVVSDQK